MRESAIENYLVQRVKAVGGLCPKFSSPGNRGVPDRIILMPDGVMVFCEVKAPRGKLSKLQGYWLSKLRRMGQRTAVVWSKDEVDKLVEELGA